MIGSLQAAPKIHSKQWTHGERKGSQDNRPLMQQYIELLHVSK